VVLVVVASRAARDRWRAAADEQRPWLTGTVAALAAATVALSVSPTSAATVPLVAVLAGSLLAAPSPASIRSTARRGASPSPGRWTPTSALAWTVTASFGVVLLVPAVAAELPLARAQQAASAGDTAGAERALSTAQRLRPWDTDTDLLGACLLAPLAIRGDTDAAAAATRHANRALARTPSSAEVLRCDAQARLALGDLPGARRQLDAALRVLPGNPELLLLSGYTYAASGALAEAVTPLRAATRNPATARRAQALLAQVDDALSGS
jgi:Flp pilus assembly protein TadD